MDRQLCARCEEVLSGGAETFYDAGVAWPRTDNGYVDMSSPGERGTHCKAGNSSGGVNHNKWILDFDLKLEFDRIYLIEKKNNDKEDRRDCLFKLFHSIEDGG